MTRTMNRPPARWIKRCGLAGVIFFTAKGCVWLALAGAVYLGWSGG